jgi:hypothetical protein
MTTTSTPIPATLRTLVLAAAVIAGTAACGGESAGSDRAQAAATTVASTMPSPEPGDFADVFGAPVGTLEAAAPAGDEPDDEPPTPTTTVPPTSVPPTVPPTTVPPTSVPPTVPSTTRPPKAAPGAPRTPPASAAPAPPPSQPAPAALPSPIAPLAPDLATFVRDFDAANRAFVDGAVLTTRLAVTLADFTSTASLLSPGGMGWGARIDGGTLGAITDPQGAVVAVVVTGDARSDAVLAAFVTLAGRYEVDPARANLGGTYDAVNAGPTGEPQAVAAGDGGHWVIESGDDYLVHTVKLQDANPDWATANNLLAVIDVLLAIPT